MGIAIVRQHLWQSLHLGGEPAFKETDAQSKLTPRRLRLLLKAGLGLLLIIWLLCVVWVEPVASLVP